MRTLFGYRSPLVHLDANAVRNLFRPRLFDVADLASLRERIRTLSKRGDLRILMTQPLLWELTSIIADSEYGGMDRYVEAIEFYTDVGHLWFMAHEVERKTLELRRRRRLTIGEAFYEAETAGVLVSQFRDSDWIAKRRESLDRAKAHERRREASARTATVEALAAHNPEWRPAVDAELSSGQWVETITKWTRLEMKRFARRQNMRVAGHQWPLPTAAPTFWFGESFLAAKARFVFLNEKRGLTSNKSIDAMPDLIDATHFRDAAYADVLVTDDGSFRTVATDAVTRGGLSLRVVGQREFASELAISQSSPR